MDNTAEKALNDLMRTLGEATGTKARNSLLEAVVAERKRLQKQQVAPAITREGVSVMSTSIGIPFRVTSADGSTTRARQAKLHKWEYVDVTKRLGVRDTEKQLADILRACHGFDSEPIKMRVSLVTDEVVFEQVSPITPAGASIAVEMATEQAIQSAPIERARVETELDISTAWGLYEAISPFTNRLLLYGPPGTGKTYNPTINSPQKVFSITLTEDTPAAELRGHYIPKGSEFIWHDGPGIRAWREGGRLVINELDHGSGDCLSFCHALLDSPETASFTLPTGETVKPADGFNVIATMNGDPDASLPFALNDRFPTKIYIDRVHPKALESLPADIRGAAKETCLLESEERRLSLRIWKEFDHLRSKIDEDVAARACFGKRHQDALDALRMARSG